MQRHLIDYIRRPDTIDDDAIGWLQTLTEQHPYFHAARILLLQAQYRKHSPSYDETLRRSAILVPCRDAIFHLTEEPHYTHAEEHKRYGAIAETDASRTTTLIDSFLQTQASDTSMAHPIDASQDYIGYLLQREREQGQDTTDALPMNGGGIVEDFLEKEPGRIKLSDATSTDLSEAIPAENQSAQNEPENEILTEIMAGIYIKQGKYENAVKIIRQLSLKYPQKNRYFADQIRFLEKLIINNKHK